MKAMPRQPEASVGLRGCGGLSRWKWRAMFLLLLVWVERVVVVGWDNDSRDDG